MPENEFLDYYEVLGVNGDTATLEEIKAAAFKLKKRLQQQVNAPKQDVRQKAERLTQLLPDIEKSFTNDESRRRYDQQLAVNKSQQEQQEKEFKEENERNQQRQGDVPVNTAKDALDKAYRLYKAKNFSAALNLVFPLFGMVTTDQRLYEILIECYYSGGNQKYALQIARDYCKSYPYLAFLAGSLLLDDCCQKEAYNYLSYAYQREPDNSEYLAKYAQVAPDVNPDEAITILSEVATHLNNNSDAAAYINYYLGCAYLNKAYAFATVVPEGRNLSPGYYYTNGSQVQNARDYTNKAKALNVPQLAALINSVENDIELASSRSFLGNKAVPIICGVVGFIAAGCGRGGGTLFVWMAVMAAGYWFSCRTKMYEINNRILNGTAQSGISEYLNGAGCAGIFFVLIFLPIIIIVNFIRNYCLSN